MTLEKLNALPIDGGMGYRIETRDDKTTVAVPFQRPSHAMFLPDMIEDPKGQVWLVGRIDGTLHKRLLYASGGDLAGGGVECLKRPARRPWQRWLFEYSIIAAIVFVVMYSMKSEILAWLALR